MTNDRISRKEELLAAARDRLVEGDDDNGSAPREIRYRGQVVRGGGRTPGSPSSSSGGTGGTNDVKVALQKIKDLYREGLITRAEAEKKRSEILDRL